MKELDLEQLIEDMTKAVKNGAEVSAWKKNRQTSPWLTLISRLNDTPKSSVPPFEHQRVRNQILDRISVPAMETASNWTASFLPRMLRIGVGAIGSLLIIVSLGLGLTVAAQHSVPGESIYPLKKIVENIELRLTPHNQRPSLQVKFASNRIEELQQVLEDQEQGKISDEQAQKVISQTVKDLQKSTNAAALVAANQPKVVNKLADLSDKIKSATIQTEGQVKIELEKALEATRISQEEAIRNIEHAGLKVENQPIIIVDSINASGKLTAVTEASVSIGTAKFLTTKDTVYVNLKADDSLKIGQLVDIDGEIKDNKTYAKKITLIIVPEVSGAETNNPEPSPTPSPSVIQ